MESLLQAMKTHKSDYQIQTIGCRALTNLVEAAANMDRARAAGAVAVVQAALELNPEDGQLQFRGQKLLEQLK